MNLVHSDETLDELRCGGLKIIQKKDGYRFSIDPVLLCAFARIGRGALVADLGTGSGVIPLVLARTAEAAKIVGVELQEAMADRAARSIRLNDLEKRVEIVRADVRTLGGVLPAQGFDAVVCNPPYRMPGTGRQAPQSERAAARHELAGGLSDFLRAGALLLREGGRFFIIYLAERLAELLTGMREAGLEPKRLRCVHARPDEPARMVLVEGRRRGKAGMSVEAPLYVYCGERYSDEVLAIYGEESSGKGP